MRDQFDVAIIGAGAAGLAAATHLENAPLDVILLEARHRIGGRAWTIEPQTYFPLDAGCGWLHSADRNPLAPLIEARGFTIERGPSPWMRQSGSQGFGPAEQRAFGEAYDSFEARLAEAAARGLDAPAADYFDPTCRWNALIDAVSSYYNGAEYDRVSVLDYAAYEDSGVNWRVREGYGAGIAAIASSCAPMLDCAVETINHSQSPIRLSTSKGSLTARAVIVTVPTPILAHERIVFTPPLPQKIEAALGLPLGGAEKAFLHLAQPDDLPIDGHLFGHTDHRETGSYNLRPFGRAYIEAYFGGRHAHGLAAEGKGAMTAFAVDELVALLGSDIRRLIAPIAETAWASDTWSLGSYSHASPGHATARRALAAPVDERIFFAGEATHAHFFSTAHGAWESGLRAAAEVLAALAIAG